MPTAVVTGANSGIGHAFAQICIKEGYETFALDVTEGEELKGLSGPKCHISKLDVSSESSIAAFKRQLGDRQLDLLLNIAGIMSPKNKDDLEHVNLAVLEKTFAVNAYGPFLLAQALLPNLLKSPQARIATMSSRVGSLADNSSGGSYAYRASKTAVNSLCKNMSVDLKDRGIIVLMIHPGIVNSNLVRGAGEPTVPEAVEPEEAAGKLWPIVQSKGIEDTGTFWHRDGWQIPW